MVDSRLIFFIAIVRIVCYNYYILEDQVEYKLGSIVIMKKQHPCKTNRFEIVRVGADIKIKCLNCGRLVMMPRVEFNKKIKKVESL